MRTRRFALPLPFTLTATLALLAAACGSDTGTETATAPEATPDAPIGVTPGAKADGVDDGVTTLTFDADFGETLSAPVVAGQPLRVRYDLDRLPDCRGTQGGHPQWNITGYAQVDDQRPQTFEVTTVDGAERVAQAALIDVPAGRELSLWFSVNNRWGCVAWDSNYGENYRVAIESPSAEAVLTFGEDGSVEQTGDLVAGGRLTVRYDLDRLPECRASQGGYPQWGASGHLKVDDGPEQTFEISEVADGERIAREATMTVPFGESLHLWFSVNDRYGCFQQDDGAVFDLGE
ncbi:DUF6209 family protein [Myxococcota bacterium]|nr:DUF6209 family protein [Myxococcota bacterium]